MRSDENLYPLFYKGDNGLCHQFDQRGIKVSFRFIPKDNGVRFQRSVDDELGQRTDLAKTFGKERGFQLTGLRSDIEMFVFQQNLASQCIFQRRKESVNGRAMRAFQRRTPQHSCQISPSGIKRCAIGIIQRNKARINRQNLACRNKDRRIRRSFCSCNKRNGILGSCRKGVF